MIAYAKPAKPITQAQFSLLKSKVRSAPDRPLWVKKCSRRIFPYGPRMLYCYLYAFSSGQCCLYNYRLAAKFGCSVRTIQLWLRWLHKNRLIHTYWYLGKFRRLVVNPYPSFTAWLTEKALPKPTKIAGKPGRLTPLSPAEFEAARQRQIARLFEV